MRDLGIASTTIAELFETENNSPYVLVRVSKEDPKALADELNVPVRRCYIEDTLLDERAETTGTSKSEVLKAKLPDIGSILSGDFGEILVFLYHAATVSDVKPVGPKKWRLKEDRNKAAPYSDVVHFILPTWPQPSSQDRILCSEVKTKATDSNFYPISKAVTDCNEKDRTSRLAKTLVWLKERALLENLGTTKVEHLERFIKATDYPPAQKEFYAVAVVCSSLVDGELTDAPEEEPEDCKVIVISVPNLKRCYEQVFDAAHATVVTQGDGQ
jgi:hypothetical protein